MAKPRITVVVKKDEKGEPAEVFFYVNSEGRDQLVGELQHLSEQSDHFHMEPEEWAMEVPLGMVPYEEGEIIPTHVKMMFRTDDWDRQNFPHVMKDDEPSA
jgi:hypothetical protein